MPLTSVGGSAQFLDQDFSMPVRYDWGSQSTAVKCTALDALLVTGITRVTGEVSCVLKNTQFCPEGTFAEQLRANLSETPPRLNYTCRGVARANCPADYVWKSLDFRKLDPGPAGSGALDCSTAGQCVYRWRNNVAWQRPWPVNQVSVRGIFCNPDVYRLYPSGGCQAVNVRKDMGTCYYQCPPCNRRGCSTCSRPAEPQIARIDQSYDPETSVVSCSLVKDEPCGSHISASVAWGGTCVIRAPEYVSPEKACVP